MLIAYAHGGGPSPQLIRSQIVSLLLEVPGHSLPLFKFRELFESRYLSSISVSDMYKMKDVCIIKEDSSGRMVSLNPDHRNTPSPSFGVGTQDDQLDLPYCTLHPQRPGADKGWAEQDLEALPNFRIGLNILAERIHSLLHSHNGSLPLPSLPNCYQVQFNKLEEDKDGVPLEHLVSCLPGIEIYQGAGCVKYLRWTKVKPNTESQSEELKCVSPPLATQLALFSRELVDLLKTSPHCQLLFNRFIPAYHHHFGRQCRVADYGFTKLIELMEALPNIVQVMGEGNKRVVTLSHRMQVRRFCSDLLRVLKSQATKHVLLAEFPKVYQRVLNKPWDIVDYGVCEMEDLLSELPENSVVVSQQENDVAISIPKREQTLEEIEKTKQFSGEVVELMRHAPQCSMLFSKFIPAYHHHFGHQCRVSDFGFTKLIELFEAIPEVVKIEDASEGERKVSLTVKESLKVLSEQMVALLRFSSNSSLLLSAVPAEYLQLYGHALRPQMYERASLEELMDCIKHVVEVVPTQSGLMITLVNQSQDHQLGLQTRRILMGRPDFKMAAPDFLQAFWRLYKKAFDLRKAEDELADIIKVDNSGLVMTFELKPLQKFACNVYRLLYECKGTIPLVSFDFMYLRLFAVPCQPALLGYPTLEALLRAIPETVLLRGGIRDQRMLVLNKDLADVTSDSNRQTHKNSAELLIRNLANGSSHFQTIGEPELDTPAKALRCDSDAPLNQFKLWSPPSFSYYNQACMPPQVNLPPCPPAPPLSYTADLLSPEKTLLSAHTLPHVVPPHPSELPLPELPSKKSCNSMDSSFGSNEPGSPSQMRREYQPHLKATFGRTVPHAYTTTMIVSSIDH
uniref:HTH OST-type domain-containing protein n=1 Tax=Timema cristinae TaxID=61476 RepID=A0A7R9CVB7_TIMCR|nr:unnamed protein product [Timema cristinae]